MNLRPRRRPVPAIPIVSLIDIMVILLIFFIATTTFKKQKMEVKISLPSSQALGGAAPAADERSTITVTKEQTIFLDGIAVGAEGLAPAIQTLKQTHPGLKLELEADTEANLGLLVQIWDALRESGIPINDVPARIQRAGAANP